MVIVTAVAGNRFVSFTIGQGRETGKTEGKRELQEILKVTCSSRRWPSKVCTGPGLFSTASSLTSVEACSRSFPIPAERSVLPNPGRVGARARPPGLTAVQPGLGGLTSSSGGMLRLVITRPEGDTPRPVLRLWFPHTFLGCHGSSPWRPAWPSGFSRQPGASSVDFRWLCYLWRWPWRGSLPLHALVCLEFAHQLAKEADCCLS